MPRGARLPVYLSTAWTLIIVLASLYPYSGWTDPGIGPLSFVSKHFPKHVLWPDFLINFMAYAPLGFFVSLSFGKGRGWPISGLYCCMLSLLMESVQMYLPARVASNMDWLANSAGGLAGAIFALKMNPSRLSDWKDSWFIHGSIGDAGIALLSLWLFTQTNPSLPLMGSWVLEKGPFLQRLFIPDQFVPAEAASIAINLLSFGLITSLMLKPGKEKLPPIVLLLFVAILIKSAAAGILLKPSVFFAWLNQEAAIGTASGLALIFMFRNIPARARIVAAAIAVFVQIAFANLTPDIASPTSELFLFDWKYGQLPTLNGATSFIARLWPFLALAYLGFIYRKV